MSTGGHQGLKEVKGRRRRRSVPGGENSICEDLRVTVSWSTGQVLEKSKVKPGMREESGKKQNKNGR